MNNNMSNKDRVYIVIAAVSAVLLICVVLVGMLDGFWPWEPGNGIINQWFDPDFGKNDETTASTEESTDPEDTTQDETEGNGEQKPQKPQKPSDNNDIDYEEPTISIEVGGSDNTTPSGGTEGTDGTEGADGTEGTEGEGDGPNTVVDEEGNQGISFKDLWDKLHGNG